MPTCVWEMLFQIDTHTLVQNFMANGHMSESKIVSEYDLEIPQSLTADKQNSIG